MSQILALSRDTVSCLSWCRVCACGSERTDVSREGVPNLHSRTSLNPEGFELL